MGASGWWYVTPYQEDFGQALGALRAEVLASGDYVDPSKWGMPALRSPDDLFENEIYWEFLGACGTHSVLDVNRVIDAEAEPGFGTVRPAGPEAILERYGTDQPTRDDLADPDEQLPMMDTMPRWSGSCMVLYADGVPDEIVFWGVSGD
ncbi:MAG: hypothetical protein HOV66_30100 [Streptomycetaceae bacterium]|jgi:hypothetical protein|nr:hypothetical protein [Streptomycetaceae bacterium]NUS59075.1 hypothetical protein [Streptomycetaceae bacterium]